MYERPGSDLSRHTPEYIVKEFSKDLEEGRVEVSSAFFAEYLPGALNAVIAKHILPQSLFKTLLLLNKNTRDVIELALIGLIISGCIFWVLMGSEFLQHFYS